MKKTILLFIMLTLQACGDTTIQLPVIDSHNSNDINSKLESNTIQPYSDTNNSIETGIYFSSKKCNENKSCKTFSPEKIDGKYFLSRNQGLNEATYYLFVKDDSYFLYSLQFLDEDLRAIGSWSEMKKIDEADLSFEIESIEQVMGSDYMGRYDDVNLNNKLDTLANQSGLLEIGSLLEGSKIPTHETIRFLYTENGYKIDCNSYIQNYKKEVDELVEQDMAAGFHFYYECSNSENIYFHNIK